MQSTEELAKLIEKINGLVEPIVPPGLIVVFVLASPGHGEEGNEVALHVASNVDDASVREVLRLTAKAQKIV